MPPFCVRRLPGALSDTRIASLLPTTTADLPCRYYGGSVRQEHVLCCVPQEGVLLMHALLKPGQHVVVTAPGYQSLYGLAKALGYATVLCASCKSVLTEPPHAAARSRRGYRRALQRGS